eukprot:8063465-Ditylum_brightwellii.AAC.2
MKQKDALWFYQLLLHMRDVLQSGIRNYPCKSYYSKVEKYTIIYTAQRGLGGTYSKKFKHIKIEELVQWDGIILCNGVRGGLNGAIYRWWQEEGSDHDVHIEEEMCHHHHLQIKWCMKLNNNETTPKRGEENYDLAHKFDLIWDMLTHNTNSITKHAALDAIGDETSWGHEGFSEPTSGLIKNLQQTRS